MISFLKSRILVFHPILICYILCWHHRATQGHQLRGSSLYLPTEPASLVWQFPGCWHQCNILGPTLAFSPTDMTVLTKTSPMMSVELVTRMKDELWKSEGKGKQLGEGSEISGLYVDLECIKLNQNRSQWRPC
jgi:hypothetical protein